MDQDKPSKPDWKLVAQHWELDGTPPSILTNRLSEEFGEPSKKSETVQRWSYKPGVLANHRIYIDLDRGTGKIEVAACGSKLGKQLTQALILITPVLFIPFILYGVPVVEWWAQYLPQFPFNFGRLVILLPYLASIMYIGSIGFEDRYDEFLTQTSLKIDEKASTYLYVVSSLGIGVYWTWQRTQIPTIIADGILLSTLLLFLIVIYRGRTSRSLQAQITIVSLLWFIWPLFILAGATLSSGSIEPTSPDSTAGAIFMIGIGAIMTVFGTLGLLYISNELYKSIQSSKIEPYRSKAQKYVITGLYIIANIMMITGIALTAIILQYTITGQYLLPETLAQTGLTQTISDGTILLNRLFQTLPGNQSTVYTLLYELLLLTPLIIVLGMWVYSILTENLAQYRVLKNSDSHEQFNEQIDIRISSAGPPIQTMNLLFGAKQYIIVHRDLHQRTDAEELKALITHEAYHLQNRDLLLNTFAAITGLLFGGKNAILALYDYPEKEREADKKAINETSSEKLIDGIYELYDLLSEQNLHPGTQVPRQLNGENENTLNSVINSPKRIYHKLVRAYAVFFGNVLLSKAHLGKEDRIQYIKRLDESKQSDRR